MATLLSLFSVLVPSGVGLADERTSSTVLREIKRQNHGSMSGKGTGGGGLSLHTVFYPSIIILWSHLFSRLLEILDLAYV